MPDRRQAGTHRVRAASCRPARNVAASASLAGRPAAGATVKYFEAHFSSDPQLRKMATRVRSALILQTHSDAAMLAGKSKPHD